jgi:hypothetical protein
MNDSKAYYFFLDKKVTKNQDIGDASLTAQAVINPPLPF